MTDTATGFVPCPITLASQDLRHMVQLGRLLHDLRSNPAYLEAITPELPAIARHDPGHHSVMMGFDFHLTPQGPRLIEVNTNAGGGLLAYRAHTPSFQGQAFEATDDAPTRRHQLALLDAFQQEWSLFQRHNQQPPRPLQRIAIMDENPSAQFLYPEMLAFARFFQHWGIEAVVCDPSALHMTEEGVFYKGQAIDLLYMRHCDFYLETPALAGLKAAYASNTICLTPNPRLYGLLADKRRLVHLSDPQWLRELGLPTLHIERLLRTIPICRSLSSFSDRSALWSARKQWVFKPANAHGSRGVVLGKSMRQNRFNELDEATTLVQAVVPPSQVQCPHVATPMKLDIRLFAYARRMLGVTARVYTGQITNFKDPHSGYAAVKVL
ncbi:conserved hypothetical protein [Magnetococcus marinus MC-1]|uniref:Uncharacterized protein n=1 Tax=Magnetococcus marinus (strain ATCC BAA-1437 / JCM 17883 / MC-1) TaxID=156889 RepID=A0LCR0_MAGMM|nr:hypothetical protein [Magnetococcus marinus]ABK45753.1 conserved hypothetical protein [Magnetococcus marinus MC-1]